jgi:hypothetical protein
MSKIRSKAKEFVIWIGPEGSRRLMFLDLNTDGI